MYGDYSHSLPSLTSPTQSRSLLPYKYVPHILICFMTDNCVMTLG